MAREVVTMEAKLLAVFTAGLSSVNVRSLCGQLQISRQTFYKYRRRFEEEGPAGLVERSRRPHSSPGMISAELEDEIVRLRKELPLDRGAQTIAYYLARKGLGVPSVATIHRVLVRRGLVTPQPEKRPRSSYRRFEWPQPNDAWQIDATRWVLASGREIWIMDLLDDHSRALVAARVCRGPTGEAAWEAFCQGAEGWGLPARLMSDNGTCFTGRLVGGGETNLERSLRALGIRHIPSSPGHPQTCGKLERCHQTIKAWLRTQPPAEEEEDLQDQLDDFRSFYNQHRPHRALGGATPAERFADRERAGPGDPIPAAPEARLLRVDRQGRISFGRYQIQVGYSLAGQKMLVIDRGDELAVFGEAGLVRRLTLDRSRRHQGNGQPPGRRPKLMGPSS